MCLRGLRGNHGFAGFAGKEIMGLGVCGEVTRVRDLEAIGVHNEVEEVRHPVSERVSRWCRFPAAALSVVQNGAGEEAMMLIPPNP